MHHRRAVVRQIAHAHRADHHPGEVQDLDPLEGECWVLSAEC